MSNSILRLLQPGNRGHPFQSKLHEPPLYQSIGEMLAVQLLKGRMTLEQFDAPWPSWQTAQRERKKLGYPAETWVNPVRSWIADNPERWDALLRVAMSLEIDSSAHSSITSHEKPSDRQHCLPSPQGDVEGTNESKNPKLYDGS
jgi:hypothetical protein